MDKKDGRSTPPEAGIPSLNALLRNKQAATKPGQKSKPAAGEFQGAAKSLNDVLKVQGRAAHYDSGTAKPSAAGRPADSLPGVEALLHAPRHAGGGPAGNATITRQRTGVQAATGRRGLLVLGVAALFATAFLFHYWKNNSVPDSEVARQLLAVVADVDRYKAAQGQLPTQLSLLPSFPKDAVEWPIENYGVQLAAPKLEYFLVDAPGGYIVIARLANEVWVYDSIKAQPLRREYTE